MTEQTNTDATTTNLDIRFSPEFDKAEERDSVPDISDVYPHYMEYQGQHKPQDVYLYLTQEGRVYVDYDAEIGGAVTMDVWHNRDLRMGGISPYSTGAEINEMIRGIIPLLERVHAGHTVDWDGSNMSGSLDDDAQEASGEIESAIAGLFEDHVPEYQIYDAAEFFEDGLPNLTADSTDEEIEVMVKWESDAAFSEKVLLSGDLGEALRERRDLLKKKED